MQWAIERLGGDDVLVDFFGGASCRRQASRYSDSGQAEGREEEGGRRRACGRATLVDLNAESGATGLFILGCVRADEGGVEFLVQR